MFLIKRSTNKIFLQIIKNEKFPRIMKLFLYYNIHEETVFLIFLLVVT